MEHHRCIMLYYRSYNDFFLRFPNNFALVEDYSNAYNASVIWITDLKLSHDGTGDVVVHGHKFQDIEPSWTNDTVSFAKFHSYIVSNLDRNRRTWSSPDLIGKGNAFHLDLNGNGRHPRHINFSQKWVFHLLDHCVSR